MRGDSTERPRRLGCKRAAGFVLPEEVGKASGTLPRTARRARKNGGPVPKVGRLTVQTAKDSGLNFFTALVTRQTAEGVEAGRQSRWLVGECRWGKLQRALGTEETMVPKNQTALVAVHGEASL